jgi:LytS/YehU family sensor histidine kinase
MFNTLNSIYSLALKKSDFTPAAILKLSQLMRYIITDCATVTVDLPKEIQVIHDYIGLEKMRFESRVDLHINIQGDLENKVIAPLLLLPYIENSFKHGVSEMIEQAWITLDLQVNQQVLKFKLINGKAPSVSAKDSHYLGLLNNKRRLELLYPEGHQITFTEDEHTFIVSLELELDKIKLPEV